MFRSSPICWNNPVTISGPRKWLIQNVPYASVKAEFVYNRKKHRAWLNLEGTKDSLRKRLLLGTKGIEYGVQVSGFQRETGHLAGERCFRVFTKTVITHRSPVIPTAKARGGLAELRWWTEGWELSQFDHNTFVLRFCVVALLKEVLNEG